MSNQKNFSGLRTKSNAVKEATREQIEGKYQALKSIVDERRSKNEPLGGLPTSLGKFHREVSWLPNRESYTFSRSSLYTSANSDLLEDIKELLKVIKKPIATTKKQNEYESKITELERKLINLAESNDSLRKNYMEKVDALEEELRITQSSLKTFKSLYEELKRYSNNVTTLK